MTTLTPKVPPVQGLNPTGGMDRKRVADPGAAQLGDSIAHLTMVQCRRAAGIVLCVTPFRLAGEGAGEGLGGLTPIEWKAWQRYYGKLWPPMCH